MHMSLLRENSIAKGNNYVTRSNFEPCKGFNNGNWRYDASIGNR